jgi:hypothetical protein
MPHNHTHSTNRRTDGAPLVLSLSNFWLHTSTCEKSAQFHDSGYDILLGNRIDPTFFNLCLMHSPQRPVFLSSELDQTTVNRVRDTLRRGGTAESLSEWSTRLRRGTLCKVVPQVAHDN